MRVTEYFAYINRMVDNDKLFSHLTVTKAIKKDRKNLDKLKRKAKKSWFLLNKFKGRFDLYLLPPKLTLTRIALPIFNV